MEQWERQESFLLDHGANVVVYDALGCGKSAKPLSFAAYSPAELYEDLIAVIKLVHRVRRNDAAKELYR